MGIQNFPAVLQPIIQQGFLEHAFYEALTATTAYRQIADKEPFPVGVGETLTKTRTGLRPVATTPLAPSTNTNFDNGLTSSVPGVEQYTLTVNKYGDTVDLNLVSQKVGILNQFMMNARQLGEQVVRQLHIDQILALARVVPDVEFRRVRQSPIVDDHVSVGPLRGDKRGRESRA